MKRKLKMIIGIVIILVLAIWLTLLATWLTILDTNPETHFKITKEGIEVDGWVWSSNTKNGIDSDEVTIEWLKENCECVGTNYMEYSERCTNEEELEVGLMMICLQWKSFLEESECQKYKCGDYVVEVWNQIK